MKQSLTLVFLFCFTLAFAQFPNAGMQRRGGNPNQMKSYKFDAKNQAGIFYYDIDKVIKKVKVKDDLNKNKVSKVLRDYNHKIKELHFLESEKLTGIDNAIQTMMKIAKENGDRESMKEVRQNSRKALRPIREKVMNYERELNDSLEKILTDKQQKRWLKYQKKEKDKLKPKTPRNQNNMNRSRMQRGGRRGF